MARQRGNYRRATNILGSSMRGRRMFGGGRAKLTHAHGNSDIGLKSPTGAGIKRNAILKLPAGGVASLRNARCVRSITLRSLSANARTPSCIMQR